jgi:hypothetical protein
MRNWKISRCAMPQQEWGEGMGDRRIGKRGCKIVPMRTCSYPGEKRRSSPLGAGVPDSGTYAFHHLRNISFERQEL